MAHHQEGDGGSDVAEVVEKELSLLQPETRSSPDAVLDLLHERFREFGASGRIWNRSAIAQALAADPGSGSEAQDMMAVQVAPDVVLLTYLARTPDRISLRSSLWVRHQGRWQLFFHQGTRAPRDTVRPSG
jgi:ribonuclease HI